MPESQGTSAVASALPLHVGPVENKVVDELAKSAKTSLGGSHQVFIRRFETPLPLLGQPGAQLLHIPVSLELDEALEAPAERYNYYSVEHIQLEISSVGPMASSSGSIQVFYLADPLNAAPESDTALALTQAAHCIGSIQVGARDGASFLVEPNSFLRKGEPTEKFCAAGSNLRDERYGTICVLVRAAGALTDMATYTVAISASFAFRQMTQHSSAVAVRTLYEPDDTPPTAEHGDVVGAAVPLYLSFQPSGVPAEIPDSAGRAYFVDGSHVFHVTFFDAESNENSIIHSARSAYYTLEAGILTIRLDVVSPYGIDLADGGSVSVETDYNPDFQLVYNEPAIRTSEGLILSNLRAPSAPQRYGTFVAMVQRMFGSDRLRAMVATTRFSRALMRRRRARRANPAGQ